MNIKKSYFYQILILTGVMLILGLLMVYSASFPKSNNYFHITNYYFKKQFIFALAGIVLMFITSKVNYNIYKDIAYPLLFIGTFLIILTYFPHIGKNIKGAHRWISLGSINLEPSEITKVFIVILLAYLLDKKQDKLDNLSFGFLPFIIIPGIVILLIIGQKDLGSGILLGAIVFIMMFIGGVRLTYLLLFIGFFAPIVYFSIAFTKYRLMRILVFLDPFKYYNGKGYQVAQSLIGIAAGGFFGKGIGCSHQKLSFLPEAYTDYIFSILAEELGFIGVFFVIALFFIFFLVGMKMSLNVQDRFGRLLGMGLTILITLQAFINIGVCMSLLPAKGIALPFFSYGGSSLVSTLFAVGILLNIARESENE
jgi:cell division protein FtsW